MKSTNGRLQLLKARLEARSDMKGHGENVAAIREEIKHLEDRRKDLHGGA